MSDKETPVYAVPVEPKDNQSEATRVVTRPHTVIIRSQEEPPIITDLMKGNLSIWANFENFFSNRCVF